MSVCPLKEAGAVSGNWVQTNDPKIEGSEFLTQDSRSVRSVDWAHGTVVHIAIQQNSAPDGLPDHAGHDLWSNLNPKRSESHFALILDSAPSE